MFRHAAVTVTVTVGVNQSQESPLTVNRCGSGVRNLTWCFTVLPSVDGGYRGGFTEMTAAEDRPMTTGIVELFESLTVPEGVRVELLPGKS